MRFWISPFELSTDGLNLLAEAGLQPWELGKGCPPSGDCLLLYDCPDQILANSSRSHGRAIATPAQLMEGYSKVLEWSEQTRQPMLAILRLQQLGPSGLGRWLESIGASWEPEALPQPQAPTIKPLVAAATLALMEACPQLLNSYLDIELKAELFGGDPDLHYRQRLREASLQGEILLQELHAIDAREEAELTLLQLHQVQEELEAIFLADQEKQRLINTQTNEIETQTKELEGRSAEVYGLREQLELREGELNDAREDAELTLLQLHQVHEELEHYFLRSQSGDALAHNQHLQLRRAQQLIARLHPPFANLGARPSITPVEVLPNAHSHPQATTLQTEALLSTYAHSLSRARALLQRSLNR